MNHLYRFHEKIKINSIIFIIILSTFLDLSVAISPQPISKNLKIDHKYINELRIMFINLIKHYSQHKYIQAVLGDYFQLWINEHLLYMLSGHPIALYHMAFIVIITIINTWLTLWTGHGWN